MVRLVLLLLAVLLQAPCWARAPAGLPATVRVCADTNEFAPYVFRERHGSARGPQVLGFDLDVLRRVLEPAGVHIEVELLPWARCVLQGTRGDFPIILDGLRSPKRERDFLFPVSHYGLTPLFVYPRAKPRPDVDSVTGLAHYRLCSQADYNYEPYGVPDKMITNRARTIEDAVNMLKLGRCEVLLQYAELLEANRAMGGADVLGDPALRSEPAQWIRHVDLYFLVSKGVPYGPRLVQLLDAGIDRLQREGELERMRASYRNPYQAALPPVLRACGDANEFPPFVFHARHGRQRGTEAVGFDVDVLNRIAADAGLRVDVDLLPWARCVLMAARGDYQILLDGVRSPSREKEFLFPASHYSLTPVFLSMRDRPRPDLSSAAALAQHRICSQADYNYEPYGVPNALITNRARTIEDTARMLELGRCEVILQNTEILQFNSLFGGADLLHDPRYVTQSVPWMRHVDFYLLVSKGVPYRQELLELIDRGVTRLKRNGDLDRMRAKYQNQKK